MNRQLSIRSYDFYRISDGYSQLLEKLGYAGKYGKSRMVIALIFAFTVFSVMFMDFLFLGFGVDCIIEERNSYPYSKLSKKTFEKHVYRHKEPFYDKCEHRKLIYSEQGHDSAGIEGSYFGEEFTSCEKPVFVNYNNRTSFLEVFGKCPNYNPLLLYWSLNHGGFALGGLFSGWLSDTFGRRIIITILYILNLVAIAVSAALPTPETIFILQAFVCGFCSNAFLLAFILVLENTRECHIVRVGMMFYGFSNIGRMFLAFPSAFLLHRWQYLCFFIVALCATLIPVLLVFMDESLRWLLVTNRTKKASKLVSKISKCNKSGDAYRQILDNLFQTVSESSLTPGCTNSFTMIFRNGVLRKRLCCVGFCWISVNIPAYYAEMISFTNPYVSGLTCGFAGVMGCLVAFFINKALHRRKGCVVIFLCAGLVTILISTIRDLEGGYHIFAIIIGHLLLLCYAAAISTLLLLTFELFPTICRATAFLLCASCTELVTSLVSVWMYGMNITGLVVILQAAMLCVSVLLMIVLPDTSKQELDETIEDIYSSELSRFS